jgi:hypothetical protein
VLTTCDACLSAADEDSSSLNCQWCPKIAGCSDGMDRNRQRWLMNSCDSKKQHLAPAEIRQCAAADARVYPAEDGAGNDHRDITFPHADVPSDPEDDDDNDVGNGVDDSDAEFSENKMPGGKKGQATIL